MCSFCLTGRLHGEIEVKKAYSLKNYLVKGDSSMSKIRFMLVGRESKKRHAEFFCQSRVSFGLHPLIEYDISG